jgi:hypothetical protein
VNKIVNIVPSVLDDVFDLEPNLRLDDINELEAQGSSPMKSLLRGFVYSDKCFTVKLNNKIIGMFGVCSFGQPKGFASIWFLGSDDLLTIPRIFITEGRNYINKFMQDYDIIVNAVDSRNVSHIKWIEKCGMILSSPIFINGIEFKQFYKTKGVKDNV